MKRGFSVLVFFCFCNSAWATTDLSCQGSLFSREDGSQDPVLLEETGDPSLGQNVDKYYEGEKNGFKFAFYFEEPYYARSSITTPEGYVFDQLVAAKFENEGQKQMGRPRFSQSLTLPGDGPYKFVTLTCIK